MTVELLLSFKLLVKHIMLQQIELIVLLLFSFKQVFVFFTHSHHPVIWIDNFIISRFVHILNFVRPCWMNRPPRNLLPLNRHLTHISDSCGQFSFFEGVDIDLDFFGVLVGTGVIDDLFVEAFFVFFEGVGVLTFKSHLHLFVCVGDKLSKLSNLLRICH
jgi:hypothetical protein